MKVLEDFKWCKHIIQLALEEIDFEKIRKEDAETIVALLK